MRLIIAQKPGVGLAIARQVGATTRAVGAWSGPGIMVSWALDHLIGIAPAGQLGFSDDWAADTLPLFPNVLTLNLLPGSGYRTQFNVLKTLIQRASRIVCATDASQEGELIFRHIYQLAGGTAPCDRLWISSLTPEAIVAGLATLRPLGDFDDLYLAAKSRAEADWLVGVNLTRAMTVQHRHTGRIISVGRLHSPTLALIAERYEAHQAFVPSPFFEPMLTLVASGGLTQPFTTVYSRSFVSEKEANAVLHRHLTSPLVVVDCQLKTITKQPLTLLQLTLVQRLANDRFGYSASHTLACLQRLYERGHVTYPLTDSAYLTEGMRQSVNTLLTRLCGDSMLRRAVALNPGNRPFQSPVVTDHHALLPTENFPDKHLLSEGERAIYDLIVERLFLAFGTPRQEQHNRLLIGTDGDQTIETGCFVATATVVTEPGWSALTGWVNSDYSPAATNPTPLPQLPAGTPVRVHSQQCHRGTTSAPLLLTESSLLALLESGGQVSQTEGEYALDPRLAKFSLSTPAARADIIETLVRRQYIERRHRSLVPTPVGHSVWLLLRELPACQPTATGKWEYALRKIEQGELDPNDFNGHLQTMIAQSIKAIRTPIGGPSQPGDALRCPACKKGTLVEKRTVYGCSAHSEGCSFSLPTQLLGKSITLHLLRAIVLTGSSPLMKGFTGKKGPFDARLELARDPDGKLGLSFVFTRK